MKDLRALVYDLAPWNASVAGLLKQVRHERPFLPILLHPPHIPGAAELILACGSMNGVYAHGQFSNPNVISSLRTELRRIISSGPNIVLLSMIDCMSRDWCSEVKDFCRTAIRELDLENHASEMTVSNIAAKILHTPRSLNRTWDRTSLPRPKEMLDWVVLLTLTLRAYYHRLPISKAARTLHLDRQRTYRLRSRLMPSVDIRNAAQAFDLAFLAFAERCGVPGSKAAEFKQQLMA